MKALKTLAISVMLIASTPALTAQAEPVEATQSDSLMITASVKGMVCDFCARAVTKVFSKKAEVKNVHVDLDNGEIHVSLHPGKDIEDAEVEKLVRQSGYSLISVSRDTL